MTAATPQIDPEILYVDNHLLVAVKDPGVLSQSDGSQTPDMLTLLKASIRLRYQKPGDVFLGLVHRLDQPVGGVMVFARTSKAAGRLSGQIREHRLEKYYLAVVHGCPEPPGGQLTDHLQKAAGNNQVRVVTDGSGRLAWLHYVSLAADKKSGFSLLGIRLGTGRPHQIRVQLASRGWPIVGDRRYGLPDDQQTLGQDSQIALFACALGFLHPTRAEPLFFAALPPDRSPWNLFASVITPNLRPFFAATACSQNVNENSSARSTDWNRRSCYNGITRQGLPGNTRQSACEP
ncbi:MAG: RNA pseudouridine synthase [Oligosphaeraceae bacterium]|nr:RNA pseudouridine synthase [Oligosphaeraceae bacterium]